MLKRDHVDRVHVLQGMVVRGRTSKNERLCFRAHFTPTFPGWVMPTRASQTLPSEMSFRRQVRKDQGILDLLPDRCREAADVAAKDILEIGVDRCDSGRAVGADRDLEHLPY